jgi:DNA-binding transcriptional MerR regulator
MDRDLAKTEEEQMVDKSPDAFRTISEVAEDLDLPQHVLRFWETRFPQIKPLKRGGGRRYYRPDDVALITGLKTLLYGQGYTIKGVQRILKEQGAKTVQAVGRGGPLPGAMPILESLASAGAVQTVAEHQARFDADRDTGAVSLASGDGDGALAGEPGHLQAHADASEPPPLHADAETVLRMALAELQHARKELTRALARRDDS